jgi:hypothetical protein
MDTRRLEHFLGHASITNTELDEEADRDSTLENRVQHCGPIWQRIIYFGCGA